MKKRVAIISTLVFIIVACMLMLHPVKVVSDTQYRYVVLVTGVKKDVDSIASMAGGYRVYINAAEYIWCSYGSIRELNSGDGDAYIRYGFPWQPPTVNFG